MRAAVLLLVLALAACKAVLPGLSGPVAPDPASAEITVTPLDPMPEAGDLAMVRKAPSAAGVVPDPAASASAPPAEAPLSAAQRACDRTGGRYVRAGASGAMVCVRQTRDGGKSCTRQGQCEGLCLARSGTCAPITPLFGCNDIFQADGRRVTLCLD